METLQLGNNAVFTVNGTVNANAWCINIDSAAASPAVINGSGKINLKNKGELLNIGEGKKLTLDGVTLVGVKDNSNSLVDVNNGGIFVMKSGKIIGNGNTCVSDDSANGGGVHVWEASFTMSGGSISGNRALGKEVVEGPGGGSGGGVMIAGNSATFTMKGGAISGNTSNRFGGGVNVWVASFTMTGGSISNNTASDGGGVFHNGAGATFIMEGGTIYGSSEGGNSNIARVRCAAQVLDQWDDPGVAKWGTGGTYTKGGVAQTGGSDIGSTDDTLIAIPAR
jgi:hypothetical protein